MGSSTGNMLVDKMESLKRVFKTAKDLNLPVMTHCEDAGIINRNMAEAKAKYGEDPAVEHHPEIRSEEACYESSKLAVELAREFGTRLHIAHVTTARELELFAHQNEKASEHSGDGIPLPQITGEAVIAHLVFSDADYATKKALIKCNPAIKTLADRDALRKRSATEPLPPSVPTMLHTSGRTSRGDVPRRLRVCRWCSSRSFPCWNW